MSHPTQQKLIFGTGLSSSKNYQGLLECCTVAIESGIRWFDTAPSYKTEEVLGQVLNEIINQKCIGRDELIVQTKIDPIHMYEGKVEQHVEQTLQMMNLDYLDCLLIHWPVYKYFLNTWKALLRIKEDGLVKRVGVCNLRVTHLTELKSIGVIPEILQIERHPLNTFEEERRFCKSNNIELQDYSPLCKMHPLLKENKYLAAIAERHSCVIGEVILCWHIQTGALPIFTSTKPQRIASYSQLSKIVLTDAELSTVCSLNINHKLYLESLICPGF